MNGIIIINHTNGVVHDKVKHKVERLIEEFNKENIDIQVIENDSRVARIENGKILFNLPKCDFIIYLDKDKYLARMLKKAGYLVIADPDYIEICDDKMLTHIALADSNIKMPKCIPAPLLFKPSDINVEFLDDVIKELGFPILVKGVYGSLGQNMLLANNKEELCEYYQKLANSTVFFQEYITSSYGKSVRVLVVGHEILGAIKRMNDNDYRSNFPVGTYSEDFILNDEFKEFVNRIIDALDIDYGGIDLLFGENDEPILCEINSNAFFAEFEKTKKVNVAKAFVEMTIKKVKEKK